MNIIEIMNKAEYVDDVQVLNPYSSINDDIEITQCIVDGKTLRLKLDKEFIVIPVEMYGVMNWQSELMAKVLDALLKLSNKKTIEPHEIQDIVRIIYRKPTTNDHIPEQN